MWKTQLGIKVVNGIDRTHEAEMLDDGGGFSVLLGGFADKKWFYVEVLWKSFGAARVMRPEKD